MTVLLVLNTAVAAVSVAFAVLAVVRPTALSRTESPTGGERFYARMYAARAVPLGVIAAVVPLASAGSVTVLCLLAAAAAQLADAGIGLRRREWGMVAGGGLVAVVHAVTAMGSG
jgi:hypothetical protein